MRESRGCLFSGKCKKMFLFHSICNFIPQVKNVFIGVNSGTLSPRSTPHTTTLQITDYLLPLTHMPKPTRKFAEMEDAYDNLFDEMNSGVQYRKTWDDFLRFNRLSGANEPREEHVVSFRSLRDLLFHSPTQSFTICVK